MTDEMDKQTVHDLEIFDASAGGVGIFEKLNYTIITNKKPHSCYMAFCKFKLFFKELQSSS